MLRDALVRIGYAALEVGMRFPEVPLLARFAEQSCLLGLLNRLKINYVLDVGANKGWFAKHLRMLGYKGQIFCCEPISSDCEAILRMASQDAAWQVFNFALGAEGAVKDFNIIRHADGTTVLSSFLRSKLENLIERTVSIEAKRLDDVLDGLIENRAEARIFLKVDTQGYDVEVLKGCTRWIDKVVLLQSELSITPIYREMPHYTQALEYYEGLGFSLMNLYVVNRTQHGSILEYDCVMARLDQF